MSERKEPPEPWTVVVVPLEGDVPAGVRLKRWLKLGLRSYGLRCVEVRTPRKDELEQGQEDPE